MRTNVKMFLAAAIFLCLVAPAVRAQHEHHQAPAETPAAEAAPGAEVPAAAPVTLEGELVCLSCYQDGLATGPEAKSCAKRCHDASEPLGLLSEQGELYRLTPGERETKTTKLANMLLEHCLMMVEMPIMMINELTNFKIEFNTPKINLKHQAPQPPDRMLGRKIRARGQVIENEEEKTLKYTTIEPIK